MDDFEIAKQYFLEGLKLLEANNLQAAETRFERSLDLIPGRVSTLNNLSVIKYKLQKFVESEDLARKAIALDDKSPEAWSNLGFALAGMKRHDEALQAYESALKCESSHVGAWLGKTMALFELKRYDDALRASDQAPEAICSQYAYLYARSLILKELNRPDEALKIYLKALDRRVAASPVYISERRATQKANVLIINPHPKIDSSFQSFEDLHQNCPNYPNQVARLFHEDYRFGFVFEGNATKPSAREKIPRPDFVINNVVNGEDIVSQGKLSGLTELADGFSVPVVNHPNDVVQTTRDSSAKLLEQVSSILIPKTVRFSSAGKTSEELTREIESQYDYPLIARTLFAQEGKWMNKVDSRQALVRLLSSDWPQHFFVTQFVDTRGETGFFRKIRAAVVSDEILITRVDYSVEWNVRGRKSPKRLSFYLANMHLLDYEKQVCANPEAALGRTAFEALRAIRDRIPLDVFGVDFDVNADGLVVFYEANATMNLFSTAHKQVPNPKESEEALKVAFQRYLASLVARR